MKPLVSVIMPLYNASAFMAEGVESVLGQSFGGLELVLIDDCSSDDSLAQAQALAAQDARIVVVPLQQNVGGGSARNAGIAVARGRYIAFLDADDLWETDKLSTQLGRMEAGNIAFSYTDYLVLGGDGRLRRKSRTPEKMSYRDLLKNTAIGCSTVVYDRQLLGDRYFPAIRKRQDFGLWLSILRDVDFAHRCGGFLTRYRVRPGSVSSDKIGAAAFTWKVYRELEGLPLLQSAYYFARYSAAAIRKRL